jgi:hypothetical protein
VRLDHARGFTYCISCSPGRPVEALFHLDSFKKHYGIIARLSFAYLKQNIKSLIEVDIIPGIIYLNVKNAVHMPAG